MGERNAPYLPEIDLDDDERVYSYAVDLGAYEYGSSSVDDTDTTTN